MTLGQTSARLKPNSGNRGLEEDASLLRFGEDFQNAQPLFIAEVKMLLEAQKESKGADKGFTDAFEKTLVYCKRFNRITRYDTVREVRRILTRSTMEPFEIAQVASLSCEDADEARALIPSLNHDMEYAELQAILMEAVSVKKFQS